MPVDKEFNTIVNQIRLLKRRGLQINNFSSAKDHLLNKNYFNLINGHETLLLDDPKNTPKKYTKKSFDHFLRLYEFDRQLSSLIFRKISEFETKLKTSIAYHFCKNHCSTLSENNNYIDINYYKIPGSTDGPSQYVNYFFTRRNPNKSHKLFRNNYCYMGQFRGTFDGVVTYNPSNTTLQGKFTGRFGSISIREVKDGTCTFSNSNHSGLLRFLHSITSTSGPINTRINIRKDVKILGLNYIDDCKIKYQYINEYKNPPFWAVIKTLMLNDIIILMYGLKKRTFEAVLRDFNLKPHDKEKFLNAIEIIKELRNACAHFELVNRFRTPQNLKINGNLISELHLNPIRSQYVIKLYDVLKVFKNYMDLSEIKSFLWDFWNIESKYGNTDIAVALLDRMGNPNINEWI